MMGYKLYREVLEFAPADLTPAELVVWMVLADDANDRTRESWLRPEPLRQRCRLRRAVIAAALRRLVGRGYELRVVRAHDKHGRAVYAYRGVQTTYRLPRLAPVDNSTERVHESEPIKPERVHENDERVHENDGKGPRERTPSPQSPHIPSPARARADEKLIDEIEGWHLELYGNPCPRTHAVAIRAMFNGTPMSNPGRYIRTAMSNDRDKYRYRPGPPRFVGGEFVT